MNPRTLIGKRHQYGYTYLLMLFVVALLGYTFALTVSRGEKVSSGTFRTKTHSSSLLTRKHWNRIDWPRPTGEATARSAWKNWLRIIVADRNNGIYEGYIRIR